MVTEQYFLVLLFLCILHEVVLTSEHVNEMILTKELVASISRRWFYTKVLVEGADFSFFIWSQ